MPKHAFAIIKTPVTIELTSAYTKTKWLIVLLGIIFKELFEGKSKFLRQKVPDLPDKVELFTRYKLTLDQDLIKMDALDLWYQTKEDLRIFLNYISRFLFNFKDRDWNSFSNNFKKYLRLGYYQPFIKKSLKNTKVIRYLEVLIPFLSFLE